VIQASNMVAAPHRLNTQKPSLQPGTYRLVHVWCRRTWPAQPVQTGVCQRTRVSIHVGRSTIIFVAFYCVRCLPNLCMQRSDQRTRRTKRKTTSTLVDPWLKALSHNFNSLFMNLRYYVCGLHDTAAARACTAMLLPAA